MSRDDDHRGGNATSSNLSIDRRTRRNQIVRRHVLRGGDSRGGWMRLLHVEVIVRSRKRLVHAEAVMSSRKRLMQGEAVVRSRKRLAYSEAVMRRRDGSLSDAGVAVAGNGGADRRLRRATVSEGGVGQGRLAKANSRVEAVDVGARTGVRNTWLPAHETVQLVCVK